MVSLIINADDFGLTEGICRAVINLLKLNAISNTTVMICMDGAAELTTKYRHQIAGRAGVHLQLTGEKQGVKPLSPPHEVPSLIDPVTGFFKPKEAQDDLDPEDVAREWTRQIERVADALQTKPTHLDTHHGRHRLPHLTPVYLKLAAQYDLPVRGGITRGQINGAAFGVRSSALCVNNWSGQNKTSDALKSMLLEAAQTARDGEVLELVCHPAYCDDALSAISSWNTVRENDRCVLEALAQEGWLEKNQIRLVRYPKL